MCRSYQGKIRLENLLYFCHGSPLWPDGRRAHSLLISLPLIVSFRFWCNPSCPHLNTSLHSLFPSSIHDNLLLKIIDWCWLFLPCLQVAGKQKYHPECFRCERCNAFIGDGDSFTLVDFNTLYWLVSEAKTQTTFYLPLITILIILFLLILLWLLLILYHFLLYRIHL